ncbi:HAD family hydrolase [bacterium]|nr:HAD family hydrolase [bacterium]
MPILPPHCRCLLFDWGNTLMVDFPAESGPMYRWKRVEAVPGAVSALERLRGRYDCHVATNARDSTAGEIRGALARVDLDRFFSGIFCFRELGCAKPSRQFFLAVASRLGCLPREMVMIGDSLENDVLAAAACGLGAVWYNPAGLTVPRGVSAVSRLIDLAR